MERYSTAMLVAVALALLPGPTEAAERADTKPRVAVMSAFPPELTALLSHTEVERKLSINGIEFTLGQLSGQDAVLFMTGESMVNASMNTQLALEQFNVRAIVFSGIAGGVNPDLRIGDVVVPERWGQYLEAIFARETPQGYELPPFAVKDAFANFGMIFPQPVRLRTAAHPASAAQPEGEERFWFEVDPGMLEAARKLEGSLHLERCAGPEHCLAHEPRFEFGGSGVSGQAFVDNKSFREYVFATFHANVLDMESAAIATVAYANATPFLIFRSLSDLAGGGPGENEEPVFFQLSASNSATTVMAFLKTWGTKP